MPLKKDIPEFTGQTYALMKDGRYFFQDEFGRRPVTSEEYDRRVKEAKEIEETVRIALEKHRAKKNTVSD